MDRYELMKLIGRGNFGRVHLVRRREDGTLFVMKVINLNELSQSERDGALQEVGKWASRTGERRVGGRRERRGSDGPPRGDWS